MQEGMGYDREELADLMKEASEWGMPFGRFGPEKFPPKGVVLMDLPPEYLAWFKEEGFPQGRLGEVMEFLHELKETGADVIFEPMRKARGGRTRLHKRR